MGLLLCRTPVPRDFPISPGLFFLGGKEDLPLILAFEDTPPWHAWGNYHDARLTHWCSEEGSVPFNGMLIGLMGLMSTRSNERFSNERIVFPSPVFKMHFINKKTHRSRVRGIHNAKSSGNFKIQWGEKIKTCS